MSRFMLVALCAAQAWAAGYTSVKSGDWSDQSVWSPTGVPGNGDTANVGNGHTVTVDADVTVGASVNAYFSYIHGVSITPGSGYTGCTSAVVSGGTTLSTAQTLWNGTDNAASCRAVSGGVYAEMAIPRKWYSVASAAPTVTVTAAGGSGASIGVVWAQGSGTYAIHVNNSGKLVIGAGRTLRVRGTILHGNGATSGVEFGSGAALIFDSSQAADIAGCTDEPGSPSCKPIYTYGAYGAGQNRLFLADCAPPADRCSISSDPAGNVGGFASAGLFQSSDRITLKYVDVSRLGKRDVEWFGDGASGLGPITIEHCRFTDSGGLFFALGGGTARNISLTDNTFSSLTGRAAIEGTFSNTSATGGVYTIARNVFEGPLFPCGLQAGVKAANFTSLTDNYFGDRTCFSNTYSWVSYARNLFRTAVTAGSSSQPSYGDLTDNYLYFDGDAANWHVSVHGLTASSTVTHSGNIVGAAGHSTYADSGEVFGSVEPSGPATMYWRNNIILPTGSGYSFAELTGAGTVDHNNLDIEITNNTWFGGFPTYSTAGFGFIQENENGGTSSEPSGVYTVVASNILWNPDHPGYTNRRPFYVTKTIDDNASLNSDVTAPAGADYNWKWNHAETASCANCSNQGRGYVSKYSVTPGANDKTGDPGFVDWQRALELFDSKYLGNAYDEWVSGQAYGLGDFVTASDPALYWGLPVNFRCARASGCSGSLKPGVPQTAWRGDGWEFASLYRIRQGLGSDYAVQAPDGALAGAAPATCTEGNNSIFCVMMAWVRKGYEPQNGGLSRAGHDGSDIGAVPMSRRSFSLPVEF